MSIVIKALAGTGKTLTLVGGVHVLRGKPLQDITPSDQQHAVWKELLKENQPQSICFTTFTVSARDEIKARLGNALQCRVTNMHGMGYSILATQAGISGKQIVLDKHKTDKLIEIAHNGMSIYKIHRKWPGYASAVKRLVQLSKYMLELHPTDEFLVDIAGQYGVALGEHAELIFTTTRAVLNQGLKNITKVDYDDMIYLPIVLDMPIPKYDLLVVDEGQDLNRCQQELALRSGREIMIAGDENQAIFGFTGADARSMQTMETVLQKRGAEQQGYHTFPLTVTRRCSRAVVEEARKIVPEYEAHEDNADGWVRWDGPSVLSKATPNDMILCRTNSPLLRKAFEMINQDIPVVMLGKKIGDGLVHLIQTLKASSVSDLENKLGRYESKELQRMQDQGNCRESTQLAVQDKCACLRQFCGRCDSVAEITEAIDTIFSNSNERAIKLSSIHQAKGLEGRNVFILHPELLPHPMAKTAVEREQERNVKYVAITRTRNGLTWVGGSEDE